MAGSVATIILTGIIYYRNRPNKRMDFDNEPSVNDILDIDQDDDHEAWSDFSIEEELPMQPGNLK